MAPPGAGKTTVGASGTLLAADFMSEALPLAVLEQADGAPDVIYCREHQGEDFESCE